MGTGKATVGDGAALGSGVALPDSTAVGVGGGSGAGVAEHPTSSTTIAMTMARRKLTSSFYFGQRFGPKAPES